MGCGGNDDIAPTASPGNELADQYVDQLDFNKLYDYARPLDLLLFQGTI